MTNAYADLKALFESKDCKLLTTEDEINKVNKISHSKVLFTAKCGHNNEVFVTNFKQKSSGVLCKNCVKQIVKDKLTEKKINNQEASWTTVQECQVIEKIQDLLKNNIHFEKTNEGCLSDCIIKPINIVEDKWLRIQVKTTLDVCHNLYSFALKNNMYTNHIVLCHCINQNKYWLIPHNVISKLKNNLNIGLTAKSVYHIYEVNEDTLFQQLIEYYKDTILYGYNECMEPTSKNQQNEIVYQQRRIEAFPFLCFEKPQYNQSYYDFKINDIPIQEKTAVKCKNKKNSFIVCLYRSSQRTKFQFYKFGMNKYYWIHVPDSYKFFIFPEEVLYEQGYIEKDIPLNCNKPMIFVSLNYKEGWYQKYCYTYDNIDEIKELFDIA